MRAAHAGIQPWSFVQNEHEAVFIPAGCPHQVRNLTVSPNKPYPFSVLSHAEHMKTQTWVASG